MLFPIYFVDDEPLIRDAIHQAMLIEGFDITTYPNAFDALNHIPSHDPAIVITDIHMPQMDGFALMAQLHTQNPHTQVIVLTGHGDVQTAVTAMKSGAYDFLEKPFATESLLKAIKQASEKLLLLQENHWLKKELDLQSLAGSKIIGHSPAMITLRRNILASQSHQMQIFVGQNGTGKRLAAQFAHDIHSQGQNELVTISALNFQPLSLVETELKLEQLLIQTNAQTLFFINAECLTAEQWTLFVQHSHSVRLLMATSQLPIQLPIVPSASVLVHHLPLLERRKEDIPALYKHFVRNVCSRYQIQPPTLSQQELQTLCEQTWPNNIRQLRQQAEWRALNPHYQLNTAQDNSRQEPQSMSERLEFFEYTLLFDTLQRHGGRLKEVQNELKVSRKTLYDKLKKHQLDKRDFKQDSVMGSSQRTLVDG